MEYKCQPALEITSFVSSWSNKEQLQNSYLDGISKLM